MASGQHATASDLAWPREARLLRRAHRLDPRRRDTSRDCPEAVSAYFPLRFLEPPLFFAAGIGRFAADAGLRPGFDAGIARFAEGALAVDRRAAERGVVDRRPYSRSGIAMSSSPLLAFCFVFFPTPVRRTISVLLFSSSPRPSREPSDSPFRLASCRGKSVHTAGQPFSASAR
jgi:hypothetical protein